MAVVPTLAAMAALTLFQHPEALPEDVSVDYSPFTAAARAIQRVWRRLHALGVGQYRLTLGGYGDPQYRNPGEGAGGFYGPGYSERINRMALGMHRAALRRFRVRLRS